MLRWSPVSPTGLCELADFHHPHIGEIDLINGETRHQIFEQPIDSGHSFLGGRSRFHRLPGFHRVFECHFARDGLTLMRQQPFLAIKPAAEAGQ